MRRAAIVAIVVSIALGACAWAQQNQGQSGEQKITVKFEDTTIGEVLKVLQQAGGFNYVLPPQYQNKRITVSLTGVTPEEALQIVLNQVGLMATNDNGVYVIRPKPTGRRSSAGTRPSSPGAPTGAVSHRAPPTAAAPVRPKA